MLCFESHERVRALKEGLLKIDALEMGLPKGTFNPRDIHIARASARRLIAFYYISNALHAMMLLIVTILVLRLFDKNPDVAFGNKLVITNALIAAYSINFSKRHQKYAKLLVDSLRAIGQSLDKYEAQNANLSR